MTTCTKPRVIIKHTSTKTNSTRARKAYKACLLASKDISNDEKLERCIKLCQEAAVEICDVNDSY